jgi:hypothetical protein
MDQIWWEVKGYDIATPPSCRFLEEGDVMLPTDLVVSLATFSREVFENTLAFFSSSSWSKQAFGGGSAIDFHFWHLGLNHAIILGSGDISRSETSSTDIN